MHGSTDTLRDAKRSTTRMAILALCGSVLIASFDAASAQPAPIEDCGDPFRNGYGPFDYRTAPQAKKEVVERNHFAPQVESLRAGQSGTVGGDLDYTLRAFPNHPRALMAMIRLGQRDKTRRPRGATFTVACYVERAVQFRPDDAAVRQIRGIYLSNHGRHPEAIKDFALAIEGDPNSASAHYNLGLAYFETKDYDRAAEEAKKARELGFTLPGLANKLKAVGRPID